MLRLALSAAAAACALALALADDTQYWHERYHGILSMAAYGDYETTCSTVFTEAALHKSFPDSKEAPWTLLSMWGPTASGLEGFNVIIPEMDKVVMVFKGIYGWENIFNMSTSSLDVFDINGCGANCTAHAAALQAYLEAKEATDDWAVVKESVAANGHQWSITGHGFGGMVAQVAALDLGWRGLSHWTHNHGASRVFNTVAANIYDALYQGEASQRCVANDDYAVNIIPESANYTFVLEGFHIYGSNTTFGMNYDVCVSNVDDPLCAGGTSVTDHDFYYTLIGHCGENGYTSANTAAESAFEKSASRTLFATSTSTFNLSSATGSTASNSSTLSSISTSTSSSSSSTSTPATLTSASSSASSASTSSSSTSSGAAPPSIGRRAAVFVPLALVAVFATQLL